jgi:hypothetical protein
MTVDDDVIKGGVPEVEMTGGGKTIEDVILAVSELSDGVDDGKSTSVLNDRGDEDIVVDGLGKRDVEEAGAVQNGGSITFDCMVMAPVKANSWPLVDAPEFMVIEASARTFP